MRRKVVNVGQAGVANIRTRCLPDSLDVILVDRQLVLGDLLVTTF